MTALEHDRMKVRKALYAKESFIVAPVFPTGGLHLIVGDSGTGKSTWSLQLLRDWSQGIGVLGGLPSYPCEWVYVSADRSLRDVNQTLKRLGYTDWNIPAYAVEELCGVEEGTKLLVPPTIFRIHELFPKAKLIFLEGLQTLSPNTTRGQSQNKAETLWIMEMRHKILNKDITIIATEHVSKSDVQSKSIRNRALGSASLIGGAGTIVSFDFPEASKVAGTTAHTDERVVNIVGPNFAPMVLDYSRDTDGRFILQASRTGAETIAHETEDDGSIKMNTALSVHEFDKVLTSKQIELWARSAGVSDASKYRWIKSLIETGNLISVSRGVYQKARQQ